MKFKNIFTFAVVAATTLVSSCVEDEIAKVSSYGSKTIIAQMTEPTDAQQGRSCVDTKNPDTSFLGLMWQSNDKIGVYSENGENGNANVQFVNAAKKTTSKTNFEGEMAGTPKYAYFPYSAANNGKPMSALEGEVLAEQPYDPVSGTLVSDYKCGTRTESEDENMFMFDFKQMFTMLRVTIDATGTALEGERLNNIQMVVKGKDNATRNICGKFTFNVKTGDWEITNGTTSNTVSMPWTTRPALEKGKTLTGFITVMPDVYAGDTFSFEITTEGHKATFSVTSKIKFNAGYVYNIPLKLTNYKNNGTYKETTITRPTISSFKFNVTDNKEQLLNNKLTWNSSKHTASFSEVKEYVATIDNDKNEITLTIPYLYKFNLKPTISSNAAKICVNNVEQQPDDVVEVDFTTPVTYTLFHEEGGSREYTVKITNTGLPVVVVKHSKTGNFNKVYDGGLNIGSSNIGGTLVNKFVDFYVRGKETDWVEDDQITVYNADGTVDCDVLGGVRLRGNTSQVYPKKPFAMKFKEKKSVLGMPKHKRWVLLANWLDHSMIRNTVAFDIAHAIEYAWRTNTTIEPGIPWNVNGQNVELVVVDKDGDAHHVGNYLLCEQIKIDGKRLDIKDPYDVEKPGEDNYSLYGHLLEVDGNYDETSQFKTSKKIPFMFKDEVTTGILNSVKTKVQGIETNIYDGKFAEAYKNLDINSVIDQWLIWELTLNREYGDPRSVYMFMDGDGKLCAGPVWDFDRGTFQNQEKATTLGNSKSYRVKPDNEWMCWRTQESDTYSYIWYKKLITDPIFQATVQKRWAIIKPYLDMIVGRIQYYGETLAESYKYDSQMWPTNSGDVKKYKSDFKDWSGDEEISNWSDVINNFVTVYQERLAGMDALITSGKFTK